MSLHQRSAPRRLMGVSAAAACIALVVAGCSNIVHQQSDWNR